MSVQAIQNEIRIARGDSHITIAEAKDIVQAAKRNISNEEIAEIQALLGLVNSGTITLESSKDEKNPGADKLLAQAVVPGAQRATVGSVMKDIMLAPAKPFTHAAEWMMDKAKGWLKALAVIASVLMYILAALAIVVCAIGTAPYGAIKGAVESSKD